MKMAAKNKRDESNYAQHTLSESVDEPARQHSMSRADKSACDARGHVEPRSSPPLVCSDCSSLSLALGIALAARLNIVIAVAGRLPSPLLAAVLRRLQRLVHPVPQHKDLPVVVHVLGVVQRVVGAAHDGLRVAVQRVMDVSGPDSREEEHDLVRPEVDRHEEEAEDVRASLQQAVQRVERQASEGRQRVLLVVDVLHTRKAKGAGEGEGRIISSDDA